MPRARIAHPALAFLLVAAACGGKGGGGTQLSNPPRLLLADVEVLPGQTSGSLEIGVVVENDAPVLVQADLLTDASRITLRADVEALNGVTTAEAGLVEPGRLRLVFGDATTKDTPQKLATGAVVRVPFDVVPGTAPGVVEVRIESILGSDPAGLEETVDQTGPTAEIRLR